jgi:hypothetical protein
MNGPETTRDDAADEAVAADRADTIGDPRPAPGPTRNELEWHRAETERLRVLVDFLARPIHAPGGADPDPDVLTAYNLAVEAALHRVRRAAAVPDARRTAADG